MRIRVRKTDLLRDECGWYENGASVSEVEIEVPDSLSDRAVSRRILASVGATGMRRDSWAGADLGSWRDGCVGVYAEYVHD